MKKDEMQTVVAAHLAQFRVWAYGELAKRILNGDDCLERIEGTASDGTLYQLEVEARWDDKPNGDIRVMAYLWADPQKRLLGFLPIYVNDAGDDFIMRPDGTFVGEDRP